jgi:membrane protein DedA with SNARE-associated domain
LCDDSADRLNDLFATLSNLPGWQLALAATWLLLQAAVIPSLPEEVVITTLGILWSQGKVDFLTANAAVLAGLLPANSAAVLIGGLAERGLLRLGPAGRLIQSDAVRSARAAVVRHGRIVVAVTRFVPLVRGPVYLACGASGMTVRQFFVVDAMAALVQVPLLLLLGAKVGEGAGSLAEAWQRVGFLAVLLLGTAAAVQVFRTVRGRLRSRA